MSASTDKIRALLAAAQDAEERYRRYSKTADTLIKLSFMLYASALAVMVAVAVAYFAYGWEWQTAASVGLALAIAGYAAYMLHDIYNGRAVKAARQACVYKTVAEAVAEIRNIRAKLEKTVEGLEQELKKRGDS
jgi:ABC-type multidrug transport system fused ATPase/permease subunit